MGIVFFDFHFSTAYSSSVRMTFSAMGHQEKSGLWECGNRRGDFQGLWATWETWFWFSTLSTARHFHSPQCSSAPPLMEAGEQLAFGRLHLFGGLRIAQPPGLLVECRYRNVRL